MTEHVMVAVRCRPLTPQEQKGDQETRVIRMDRRHTFFYDPAVPGAPRTFEFDQNFWSLGNPQDPNFASQRTVFETVGVPLVAHAMLGYNACIFAYGQTSSGKTYTMMGPPGDASALGSETRAGLTPRICNHLFQKINELCEQDTNTKVQVKMAYYEIYNEKVYCLLNPELGESLRVREDRKQGVHIEGITEVPVEHFFQIQELMKLGNKGRHTAQTRMNDRSSRSHAVFALNIVKRQWHRTEGDTSLFTSRMNLVDLAGSERTAKAGTEGQALKEGIHINLSLSHLGVVIRKLADLSSRHFADGDYVPYRDSLLTRVLQDNLGGSSRTVMLATISPSVHNADETLNTLRYAERVKFIRNTPVINESSSNQQVLALRKKVRELEALMAEAANGVPPLLAASRAWDRQGLGGLRSESWAGGRAMQGVRAVRPALVVRTRPRRGDLLLHTLQEGFTIVSDVVPDDHSPERSVATGLSPGESPWGGDSQRRAVSAEGMLRGPSYDPEDDDAMERSALGRSGAAPPPNLGSSRRSDRRGRRASLLQPTFASGFKDRNVAPTLGQAHDLGRSVAHTVLQMADDDTPPPRAERRTRSRRSSQADGPAGERKMRGRSSSQVSQGGRRQSKDAVTPPRARRGSQPVSLERALQIAHDRMERQEGQAALLSEDETVETGQIVESEAPSGGAGDEGDIHSGSQHSSPQTSVQREAAIAPMAPGREECHRVWELRGATDPQAILTPAFVGSLPDDGDVGHLRLTRMEPGDGQALLLIKCQDRRVWLLPLCTAVTVDGAPATGAREVAHGAKIRIMDYPAWELVVPRDPSEPDPPADEMLDRYSPSNALRHRHGQGSGEREAVQELACKLGEARAAAEDERKRREAWERDCENKQVRIESLLRDLHRVQDEREDIRRRLAEAEAASLEEFANRQDHSEVTGVHHKVFQRGTDGQWRPLAGGSDDRSGLVLVDSKAAAGAKELECESLRRHLLKAEGELMRARDEHAAAMDAVGRTRDAAAQREAAAQEREREAVRREEAMRRERDEARRTADALHAQLDQLQRNAEQAVGSQRREAESRIQELEGEVNDMYARLRRNLQDVSDKRRAIADEAAQKEERIERRRIQVMQEEHGKNRQLDILRSAVEQLKDEQRELLAVHNRKLTEITADIEERHKELKNATAELALTRTRVDDMRLEEERWRAWVERLKRAKDDMVDITELNSIDEMDIAGFRLDDPIMRRRGIKISHQSRQPVVLRFAPQHLRVLSSSSARLAAAAQSAGGSRGAIGQPSAVVLKELRYDGVRAVRRLDGGIIEIDSQGFTSDVAVQCDDRTKRCLVGKLLQLKTKGVIVGAGGPAAGGEFAADRASPPPDEDAWAPPRRPSPVVVNQGGRPASPPFRRSVSPVRQPPRPGACGAAPSLRQSGGAPSRASSTPRCSSSHATPRGPGALRR
eukprot:TRINITY_DN1773_c1_g3_i1.p1 TRINITY_DN1773_c1_g3~~TRINITY_DN1773_c1_g3_i1.p1  ORF type:complete len:1438 (+),score=462.47 TRINITY_DN1773_c1_g3_i1:143-4456(+)